MLLVAERAIRPPPRYWARLPWIGPVRGETLAGGVPRLRVAGAADPLVGEALAALFLPVVRRGGRFSRPVGSGWAMPGRNDAGGRFLLEPRLAWWSGRIAGLLMVLLYDRSYTLYEAQAPGLPRGRHQDGFPGTWQEQLRLLRAGRDPDEPQEIGDLPEAVRNEIEYRLEVLLHEPATALELGRPPTAGEITFALASCQYPANFIDGDVAQRSYERLRRRVEEAGESPSCLLLVGDQVYIDPTAGLFDPSALSDRYDLPYESLLRTQPLRHVLRRLPVYTMLDDHELQDNWEPLCGDVESRENLRQGREYYVAYQRMATPPQAANRLWYQFYAGSFPFFMADTRTGRQLRSSANFAAAPIMDDAQFAELRGWLDRESPANVPMFIASPASFLPRHRAATHGSRGAGALRSDGWDGYPASFHGLIQHIAANRIRNVVFLSGDEHISFAATAVIRDSGGNEVTRFVSIHSSGLYSPFPFANSTQDSIACCESFRSGSFTVEVSTEFALPGDGFALVRAKNDGGRWRIRCLFDREPGPRHPERWIDLA